MAAAKWCFVLLSFFIVIACIDHGQSSTNDLGFISIDCGLPNDNTYVDPVTGITYESDTQFTETGINLQISRALATSSIPEQYLTLRSFPNGSRNCYDINSVNVGSKYLIRASFFYGNYDGLNKTTSFDLYLGVNLWNTIRISDPSVASWAETITLLSDDHVTVCLVNTGNGTPFISELDLRPLNSTSLYPSVNASTTLVLSRRLNMGPQNLSIRYPDDPYDRIWDPYIDVARMSEISTNSTVQNTIETFQAPSPVMQTAVIPLNSNKLQLSWTSDLSELNSYYPIMYFAELQQVGGGNATRQFNLYLNGVMWLSKPYSPTPLTTDTVYSMNPSAFGYKEYNASLEATSNSTLPPLLNALEIFSPLSKLNMPTDGGDVSAMAAIRAGYNIKRNWVGDPCAPKAFAWEGLSCNYTSSSAARITTVNLSSSGLTGTISTYFASLGAVETLDLSYNNIAGKIPAALADLSSLKLLDLRGNRLNGSIPFALLTKSQNGSLTLRTEDNPKLCVDVTSCEVTSSKKISTPVIVVLCVVTLLILAVISLILYRRKISTRSQYIASYNKEKGQQGVFPIEIRQFTYLELQSITNNFERTLGRGGFGAVFYGILEDSTQVAVKMKSQLSSQGHKEFLAEAQHLTRVHHKNLVSFIGYCKDGDYMGLVYEFMSQGTLEDHLKGTMEECRVITLLHPAACIAKIAETSSLHDVSSRSQNSISLTWEERLKIALESAQGLEYLHRACKPPLIHRDIKTANILLSERLEAKIADFGLSKAFQNDIHTHVSTAVMGTPGYLDPEYHCTLQLSEKSDVYSFGVVLLELVTGKPPILPNQEDNGHISYWVRQKLARGNIEEIADARFQGNYNVNSIWKCADLALNCTAPTSHQRPTMSQVVMKLKESLELESAHGRSEIFSTSNENLYSAVSHLSQNSIQEAENAARIISVR